MSMANITAAAAALTAAADAYHGKIDDITALVDQKSDEVDAFLQAASNHFPLIRISPNQIGVIDPATNNLQGWAKNAAFPIAVSLVRTIVSGIPFAARPPEDQAVLIGMGMVGDHFSPNINVMKMVWNGWTPALSGWTIMPGSISGLRWCTSAAYTRLVAGGIGGKWCTGITPQWGLTGENILLDPGGYLNAHPVVTTGAGEIEFIWAAVTAGFFKIDRANPFWGIIPSAIS